MIDRRTHTEAELDLIQKRERREALEREECRSTRERLEKTTSGAPRLSFARFQNGLSAQSAGALPGLRAIEEVRKVQSRNRRSGSAHTTAHNRLMKAYGGVERFNRLSADIADTNFDFSASDPGREKGRYGGSEEGGPTLRPGERIRDAEGRVHGPEAGRHQPSGQLEGIEAGFLLDVTRLLLAALKERAYKPV